MLSEKRAKLRLGRLAMHCSVALIVFSPPAIAAPPPNDNFADAIAIPTGPSLTIGTTIQATREDGEPTAVQSGIENPLFFPLGMNSVWWKWTSPSNYVVKFSTVESSFDTQLGIYTGNAVSALTEITSNDDRPYLVSGRSDVLVSAVQGTTYYILIAGFESVAGQVKLNRTDVARLQLNVSRESDSILISGTCEWRGTISLQSSTNMTEWSLVRDFLADGVRSFSETAETNSPALFYRAVIH